MNAIANANGSYTYTPGWGTVLPAGDHTLSLLFQPSDPTRYTSATATVTINVGRAVPTVAVSGGTFTYDGQPHPATGTVTGAGGTTLGPLTFTYNGMSTPPVDAGVYEVLAEFAGNADYEPVSRTATVTITKATPSMTVTGGTFTYDGQPHGASATVSGIGGVDLGPATLTYDGSSSVPVNAGTYVAVASFDGGGNYGDATGPRSSRSRRRRPSSAGAGRGPSSTGRPSELRSSTRPRTWRARSRTRPPQAPC